MSISVVICIKDRSLARLKRCINSFKDSDLVQEIIVVDYCSKVPIKLNGKKIKVIRSECTLWNKSHALNLGIKRTKSEYIATVDCDMILSPWIFEEAKQFLDENAFILDKNVHRIKIKDLSCGDFSDNFKKSYNWFPDIRSQIYNRAFGGLQIFHKNFIELVHGYCEEIGYGWGYVDNILYEQAFLLNYHIINLNVPILHQEHPLKKEENLKDELQSIFKKMRLEKPEFINSRFAEGKIVNLDRWGAKIPNAPYFNKWIKCKLKKPSIKTHSPKIKCIPTAEDVIKEAKKGVDFKLGGRIYKIF